MRNALLSGFLVGGSLIIAIGAQNATLLRMGLLRRHVGLAVAICIIGDASLIALGIAGVGSFLTDHVVVLSVLRWSGAAYLGGFALLSLRSALRGGRTLASDPSLTSTNVAVTMITVTWLNPHVYVDTVMVMGTVSTSFHHDAVWFGVGALICSILWFSTLGFGARLLRPLFQRPSMWRILDAGVGVIVASVAVNLTVSALRG
jgi:L-lysine exporter family protein LysE/ArgO